MATPKKLAAGASSSTSSPSSTTSSPSSTTSSRTSTTKKIAYAVAIVLAFALAKTQAAPLVLAALAAGIIMEIVNVGK